MYTWGYVKEAALMEMDISIKTAIDSGLINKFPFFANAIMTQICSAVKPRWTAQTFKVRDREKLLQELTTKYDVAYFNDFSGYTEYQLRKNLEPSGELDFSFLSATSCQEEDLNDMQMSFLKEYKEYTFLNTEANMPDDFISYGTEPVTVVRENSNYEEAFETDFEYRNYKSVIFFTEGEFRIPYNARWFMFLPNTDDKQVLDIPSDIVDCLPLYIASQCLKVDDEHKATILRQELELAIARIDSTHLVQNKTFKTKGDW